MQSHHPRRAGDADQAVSNRQRERFDRDRERGRGGSWRAGLPMPRAFARASDRELSGNRNACSRPRRRGFCAALHSVTAIDPASHPERAAEARGHRRSLPVSLKRRCTFATDDGSDDSSGAGCRGKIACQKASCVCAVSAHSNSLEQAGSRLWDRGWLLGTPEYLARKIKRGPSGPLFHDLDLGNQAVAAVSCRRRRTM